MYSDYKCSSLQYQEIVDYWGYKKKSWPKQVSSSNPLKFWQFFSLHKIRDLERNGRLAMTKMFRWNEKKGYDYYVQFINEEEGPGHFKCGYRWSGHSDWVTAEGETEKEAIEAAAFEALKVLLHSKLPKLIQMLAPSRYLRIDESLLNIELDEKIGMDVFGSHFEPGFEDLFEAAVAEAREEEKVVFWLSEKLDIIPLSVLQREELIVAFWTLRKITDKTFPLVFNLFKQHNINDKNAGENFPLLFSKYEHEQWTFFQRRSTPGRPGKNATAEIRFLFNGTERVVTGKDRYSERAYSKAAYKGMELVLGKEELELLRHVSKTLIFYNNVNMANVEDDMERYLTPKGRFYTKASMVLGIVKTWKSIRQTLIESGINPVAVAPAAVQVRKKYVKPEQEPVTRIKRTSVLEDENCNSLKIPISPKSRTIRRAKGSPALVRQQAVKAKKQIAQAPSPVAQPPKSKKSLQTPPKPITLAKEITAVEPVPVVLSEEPDSAEEHIAEELLLPTLVPVIIECEQRQQQPPQNNQKITSLSSSPELSQAECEQEPSLPSPSYPSPEEVPEEGEIVESSAVVGQTADATTTAVESVESLTGFGESPVEQGTVNIPSGEQLVVVSREVVEQQDLASSSVVPAEVPTPKPSPSVCESPATDKNTVVVNSDLQQTPSSKEKESSAYPPRTALLPTPSSPTKVTPRSPVPTKNLPSPLEIKTTPPDYPKTVEPQQLEAEPKAPPSGVKVLRKNSVPPKKIQSLLELNIDQPSAVVAARIELSPNRPKEPLLPSSTVVRLHCQTAVPQHSAGFPPPSHFNQKPQYPPPPRPYLLQMPRCPPNFHAPGFQNWSSPGRYPGPTPLYHGNNNFNNFSFARPHAPPHFHMSPFGRPHFGPQLHNRGQYYWGDDEFGSYPHAPPHSHSHQQQGCYPANHTNNPQQQGPPFIAGNTIAEFSEPLTPCNDNNNNFSDELLPLTKGNNNDCTAFSDARPRLTTCIIHNAKLLEPVRFDRLPDSAQDWTPDPIPQLQALFDDTGSPYSHASRARKSPLLPTPGIRLNPGAKTQAASASNNVTPPAKRQLLLTGAIEPTAAVTSSMGEAKSSAEDSDLHFDAPIVPLEEDCSSPSDTRRDPPAVNVETIVEVQSGSTSVTEVEPLQKTSGSSEILTASANAPEPAAAGETENMTLAGLASLNPSASSGPAAGSQSQSNLPPAPSENVIATNSSFPDESVLDLVTLAVTTIALAMLLNSNSGATLPHASETSETSVAKAPVPASAPTKQNDSSKSTEEIQEMERTRSYTPPHPPPPQFPPPVIPAIEPTRTYTHHPPAQHSSTAQVLIGILDGIIERTNSYTPPLPYSSPEDIAEELPESPPVPLPSTATVSKEPVEAKTKEPHVAIPTRHTVEMTVPVNKEQVSAPSNSSSKDNVPPAATASQKQVSLGPTSKTVVGERKSKSGKEERLSVRPGPKCSKISRKPSTLLADSSLRKPMSRPQGASKTLPSKPVTTPPVVPSVTLPLSSPTATAPTQPLLSQTATTPRQKQLKPESTPVPDKSLSSSSSSHVGKPRKPLHAPTPAGPTKPLRSPSVTPKNKSKSSLSVTSTASGKPVSSITATAPNKPSTSLTTPSKSSSSATATSKPSTSITIPRKPSTSATIPRKPSTSATVPGKPSTLDTEPSKELSTRTPTSLEKVLPETSTGIPRKRGARPGSFESVPKKVSGGSRPRSLTVQEATTTTTHDRVQLPVQAVGPATSTDSQQSTSSRSQYFRRFTTTPPYSPPSSPSEPGPRGSRSSEDMGNNRASSADQRLLQPTDSSTESSISVPHYSPTPLIYIRPLPNSPDFLKYCNFISPEYVGAGLGVCVSPECVRENYIEEMHRSKSSNRTYYYCRLCESVIDECANLRAHLSGSRHAENHRKRCDRYFGDLAVVREFAILAARRAATMSGNTPVVNPPLPPGPPPESAPPPPPPSEPEPQPLQDPRRRRVRTQSNSSQASSANHAQTSPTSLEQLSVPSWETQSGDLQHLPSWSNAVGAAQQSSSQNATSDPHSSRPRSKPVDELAEFTDFFSKRSDGSTIIPPWGYADASDPSTPAIPAVNGRKRKAPSESQESQAVPTEVDPPRLPFGNIIGYDPRDESVEALQELFRGRREPGPQFIENKLVVATVTLSSGKTFKAFGRTKAEAKNKAALEALAHLKCS